MGGLEKVVARDDKVPTADRNFFDDRAKFGHFGDSTISKTQLP